MSEVQTPKRRFWQIHLLTLVIASLGVGVLLMLNLQVRKDYAFGTEDFGHSERYFGWPLIACDHHRGYHMVPRYGVDTTDHNYWESVIDEDAYFLDCPLSSSAANYSIYFEAEGISPWHKSPFQIDVLANGVVLIGIIILPEYLIRRREGCKK